MIKISPSILSADFSCLADEVKKIDRYAEMLHFDVMDGHFVNNITLGPKFVSDLRKKSSLIFDVHLMITNPYKFIEVFAQAGADILTIHAEAEDNISNTIKLIKSNNVKAGIAINPNTPLSAILTVIDQIDMVVLMTVYPGFSGQEFIPEVLPKIKELRGLIDQQNLQLEIEIDGGINRETAKLVIEAGADILVAGSFVYGHQNPQEAIKLLKNS